MATAIIPRNYNMSDAELCMFTSKLCITMTRDLTDLADFGITAPKIRALRHWQEGPFSTELAFTIPEP
jgi:hypothetical protein